MRTNQQQEEETLAKRVFDLGKEHHGLVYQRLGHEHVRVRRPDGYIVRDWTLSLTKQYRLTSYGVAYSRRRFFSRIAVPIGPKALSRLDDALLSELANAILGWKHA